MKIFFAFCFIILSASLFSCSKEVSELPEATQTGANTFGCKIDGSFWVPAGFGIVPTASILEARFMPGRDLIINARNFSSSPVETELELFVKNAKAPGTYLLNTNVSYPTIVASYGYYVHRKITPDNEWITSGEYTGSITITKIDTVNGFVSGNFAFHAINLYNTPQSMNITEGRFDVRTQ